MLKAAVLGKARKLKGASVRSGPYAAAATGPGPPGLGDSHVALLEAFGPWPFVLLLFGEGLGDWA